jgi:3',5'-cyclic AMP phosphodiesterase CpdA
VDHVVVTGDVTADGAREELALARAVFSSYGLLHPDRLTLIPGNHDIFGGVRDAEDVLSFPSRCRTADTAARRAAFYDAFGEAFAGVAEARDGARTPFVKTVGPVAFIGVDSIAPWSRLRNPLGSNGAVDGEEFRALDTVLSSGILRDRTRILLLHHHLRKPPAPSGGALAGVWNAVESHTMKLRGKKPLLRLLRRHGVDIVLHGHLHENSGYTRDGVRFLNGGGSVLGPSPRHLGFNLVTLTRDGVRMEVRAIPAAPPRSHLRKISFAGMPPEPAVAA